MKNRREPSTRTIVEDTGGDSLKVEVISEESEFDSVGEEWNRLVDQADVHIFQTFEWQRIWWRIFGGNNRLHILLFREGERLAGIVPFFLDYFHAFGVPVYRCLRMIGSRVMQPERGNIPVELAFSDYLSAVIRPGYEGKVRTALLEHLRTHQGVYDELILEEVPEQSSLLNSLRPELAKIGWSAEKRGASVCPQIQFPNSWDELLSGLSSNARYQIRRDVRRVTDDRLFELQTARTREEVEQAFNALVTFHQQRWHHLGRPGIFADPRILKFFWEVTLAFHQKGWLLLKSLTADGEFVAIDLLFRFKGTIYMIQRGFDDASELNKYGPGNVLLYCVIKEAIDDGFSTYDFLRGEESYKLRTANRTPQNAEMIFQRRTGIRPPVNSLLRGYTHLKRKMQNEREVLGVHMEQENTVSALGSYLSEAYRRGARKIYKAFG